MTCAKLTLVIAATLAATAGGCNPDKAKVVSALEATWTTIDPTGQPELVKFDGANVIYAYGTDGEYRCPYGLRSFHEERGVIELKIRCKRRIGADDWVNYSLQFEPDQRKFVMSVEGQPAGVYTRP